MSLGDCVRVIRSGERHEGIDCGDGTVIHLDDVEDKKGATVLRTSIDEFSAGERVEILSYSQRDVRAVVVRRAVARIGDAENFLNCVHFVQWCMLGYVQTRADFRDKPVGELIDALNTEVDCNAWVYSRSVSLSLLHEALLASGLDCTAVIDERDRSMSLREPVELDGRRIVIMDKPSSA